MPDYGARGEQRQPFNVLLTPDQRRMLEWLSRKRDQTMGGVLREALQRMHEQERAAAIRRSERLAGQ